MARTCRQVQDRRGGNGHGDCTSHRRSWVGTFGCRKGIVFDVLVGEGRADEACPLSIGFPLKPKRYGEPRAAALRGEGAVLPASRMGRRIDAGLIV